jgi:hypothetical protein
MDYHGKMLELVAVLLKILARGLPKAWNCSPNVFDELNVKPSAPMRLLHYKPQAVKKENQLEVRTFSVLSPSPLPLPLCLSLPVCLYRDTRSTELVVTTSNIGCSRRPHRFRQPLGPASRGRYRRIRGLVSAHRDLDPGAGQTALIRNQHGRNDAEVDHGILPQRTPPCRQPQHKAQIQRSVLPERQLGLGVPGVGWIGRRNDSRVNMFVRGWSRP